MRCLRLFRSAGRSGCGNCDESLFHNWGVYAIESASSFPLRGHSVHVTEAGIVVSGGVSPFRVVLSLIPCNLSIQPNCNNVSNGIGSSTPRGFKRSPPCFGKKWRLEHVIHAVFENTGVDGPIFINELELCSVDRIILVSKNVSVIWGGNLT